MFALAILSHLKNLYGSKDLDDYPDLAKHHSFMKTHLTRELYERYSKKTTKSGVTLDQCIQTGIDDPTLDVGLVAGDAECYEIFKDLFHRVIQDYHHYDPRQSQFPFSTPYPDDIKSGRLDDDYVISSRIRCGRSISGFPFSPTCKRGQRRKVESILRKALNGLKGSIAGEYSQLSSMSQEKIDELIDAHFLFAKPASDFMRNAGMGRDWPDARGIFFNHTKNFIVWVNEEDHIRIISMQKGGDLKAVFDRFCEGLNRMEKSIEDQGYHYERSPNLGYLCTCPTNIGTSVRCSVHIKLPLLGRDERFKDILKPLRLEKRGTGGEYRKSKPDTYDISNLDRLGKTESNIVQGVITGVNLLIQMEKRLERGQPIDDLIR